MLADPESLEQPFYEDLAQFDAKDALILAGAHKTFEFSEQALVEKLLARDSDFEEGSPLFTRIRKALVEPDIEQAEGQLFDLGVEVAQTAFKNKNNTRAQTVALLAAFQNIDRIKVGFLGAAASTERTNRLMSYAELAFADYLPANEKTLSKLESLANDVHSLYHKDAFMGWFAAKLSPVWQRLIEHKHFLDLGQTYAGTIDLNSENVPGESEIDSDISTLIAMTMQDRRYGLKPAYTQAAMGGSWIFYDGHDFYESNLDRGTEAVLPGDHVPLAVIFHSPQTELKNLRIEKKKLIQGNGHQTILGGALEVAEPDLMIVLGSNGELYGDFSAYMSVRDEMRASPLVFQQLRAELVSYYHDLVVPAASVNNSGNKNVSQMDQQDGPFNPILQLLSPRIKNIGTHQDSETSDTSRTIREHDVVWHVRVLPNGWKPSPDALQKAKEHGITLQDNETFVKAHQRGIGNRVLGHEIVSRF